MDKVCFYYTSPPRKWSSPTPPSQKSKISVYYLQKKLKSPENQNLCFEKENQKISI